MEARQLLSDARLWLEFGERKLCLSGDDATPFMIGRDEASSLKIERPFVSRYHARIVRNGQDFWLVDESANGTFVRLEDERVVYLHRKRVRLWGSGYLSFGEPLTESSVVRFDNRD